MLDNKIYVSNLAVKDASTPAEMKGGATRLTIIQNFLSGFCNMIMIRITAMKVELMWTQNTPNS